VNDRKPRRPSDDSARRPPDRAKDPAKARANPPARSRGVARGERRNDGTRARGERAGGSSKRAGGAGGPRADRNRKAGGAADSGRQPRRGGRPAGQGRGQRANGGKRTSRNTDERNPTRSGVDYPSRKYRRKGEEPAPSVEPKSTLRKVRRGPAVAGPAGGTRPERRAKPAPARRRRRARTGEGADELARLAGRGARHAQAELAKAADAFAAGRERDAARLLRPLRDTYPSASAVRELLGLCQYRLGQYAAATKELEAFADLTGSVEQHPVLMDCARAQGRRRRVDELWEELAAASPNAALVSEGRIVLAGTRADEGRLSDAIAILDRRGGTPKRVQEHHLRVWYALADLYERAGDLPKARELFLRVRRYEAAFADVAERLATLG